MAENEYDVIVIGSGPGGYVAAIRCAQLGLKTACVEKSETLGGTCLNIGCIPSKALLQTTESYQWLREEAVQQGIHCTSPSFDWPAIQSRKQQVVDSLVSGIPHLFSKVKVDRLSGEASFLDAYNLRIGERSYRFKQSIIATGSQPIALPFLPFDEKNVLSSTGALSLQSIPQDMLVIGAGVIGLELASVYNRMGTKITVIEMLDTIVPTMDTSISKALLQSLKKQGFTFHLQSKVLRGATKGDKIEIVAEIEKKETSFTVDKVLVAVGRKPYTQNLGLDSAGITTDARGFIPVSPDFRTNQPHIYAIGDVIEGPMLAHRASEEGMGVAELIGGQHPKIDYMTIPNVVYTHPEAASVGFTEQEAKQAGISLFSGTAFFKGNGRARCSGETTGFVKVLGDSNSGRLIGMHMLGAHVSELISEGVVALARRMTVEELAKTIHAHPTLSEVVKEACLHACQIPIHG